MKVRKCCKEKRLAGRDGSGAWRSGGWKGGGVQGPDGVCSVGLRGHCLQRVQVKVSGFAEVRKQRPEH